MNAATLSEKLAEQTFLDPGMISASLEYWFTDHEHIRSPFPEYMRQTLATETASKMLSWTNQLNDEARKEISQEMLVEKFEELLFEGGHLMAQTEDEKITIKYPFMPRTGDPMNVITEEVVTGTGIVVKRSVEKEGDAVFLVLEVADENTKAVSVTRFELPE
jgi:S-adenosylhomocysteine hydrolase